MNFNDVRTRVDAIAYVNAATTDAERDRRKMITYALLYPTLYRHTDEHPPTTRGGAIAPPTQE